MRWSPLGSFCILCLLTPGMFAQSADPAKLSVDRIYASADFQGEYDRAHHWLDSQFLAQVAPSKTVANGSDLIRIDPRTGQQKLLVSAEKLIPPGKGPLPIEEFAFSQDGKVVLIFTHSARVWRRHTRGDYWTYHLASGKLVQHGKEAKPSTLMFAKLSPDGKSVGYVRENNLYLEPSEGGAAVALTSDGNADIINGTFDWVYEEEFDCRDGWRFRPDGKAIAYWQLNTQGVPRFTMVDNLHGKYPQLLTFPYPKTGEQNSLCRIGVVPVAKGGAAGAKTTWIAVPGDTRRDFYLPRMEWAERTGGATWSLLGSKEPSELVIQRVNRAQNATDFLLADTNTGQIITMATDRDGAWIDIHEHGNHWLEKGSRYTFLSERDGWRHLYSAARDGSDCKRLTVGNFDLHRVLKIDEAQGLVYFLASPGAPTEQYLYRARLGGKEAPERLTPAEAKGWNDYQVHASGSVALWSHSSFGTPPVSRWVDLGQHRVIRTQITNEKLKKALATVAKTPVEFFQIDNGEGVLLDAWMMKPPQFDPKKKYPLVFHVYGEPAGATVVNRWGGSQYLWHLMLAQHGYLVVSVDNRGTNAPRGRDWRKSVYRKIGIVASRDQAAAARELAKRPYVDASRIAVWGWSGGGSMTLNLLFRYPEIYRAGMSVAPVPDMSLYDTIYQERYMGLPQENGEDYKLGSPITHAKGLKGDLLLVHGTGDDNCHYQGMEKLIDVLIGANKPFVVLPYPNRSHSISEGTNTTRHLFGTLTQFLESRMPPGPK